MLIRLIFSSITKITIEMTFIGAFNLSIQTIVMVHLLNSNGQIFSAKLPTSPHLVRDGTNHLADIPFLKTCNLFTSHLQFDFIQYQLDFANCYKVDFEQTKSQAFAFQFPSLFGSTYLLQGLITRPENYSLKTRLLKK